MSPASPRFCPHYPRPQAERPSAWRMFFSKRRSWLDSLYARSYEMKMGEVHLPGVDLYMVNEPGLVRRVMVDEAEAFPKHAMLGDALRPLLLSGVTGGIGLSLQLNVAEVKTATTHLFVCIIADFTERKRQELRLRHANELLARQTTTDGLTRVGNRRLFDELLRQVRSVIDKD